MDQRRSDPPALRVSLAILRTARRLVPRALRDRWMREWEAEVRHGSSSMQRRAGVRWQQQAHLVKRSSGAFADAAFLRRQLIAHYLTTALRHFRRHKTVSGVNVASLALGLTCFIVAWGATAYSAQADRDQSNAARLHIVIMSDASAKGAPVPPVSSRLLAESLAADFPQLEAVARATPPVEVAVTVDDTSRFAKVVFADPPMLAMFDLTVLDATTSETKTLLEAPGSAIVSQSFARRLFGTDRVVGRTFRLGGGTAKVEDVTIKGVVGAIKQPSQLSTDMSAGSLPFALQFDILVSSDVDPARDANRRWTSRCCFTYVLLPSDGSLTADAFNDQLVGFARRNVPADGTGELRFEARPAADTTQIWLDALVGANATGISSAAVLMMLGGLVLLVACFNYANLATAQSLTHAREISVRRVLGADRYQIVIQQMVEGLVLTAVALALSLVTIVAIMLVVEPATFFAVADVLLPMRQLWALLVALVVVVTVCASAYPAIALCGVPPAVIHRGRGAKGQARLSSLLVGLQFAFAGFLLVAVFVTISQNRAMQRAIANPDSDPVVVIASDLGGAGIDQELLKTELAGQPGVRAVGGIDFVPWGTSFRFAELAATADPSASQVSAGQEIVGPNFFDAMEIRLLAGRNFDEERAADTADVETWVSRGDAAQDYNVVIDRDMVTRMGLGTPEEAIGKVIYRPISQTGATPPHRLHVIGVAENAVIQPLNFGAPIFYLMNRDAAVRPVIRVAKQDVAGALARIDAVWEKLAPGVPLRRRFANEQYEASYGFLNVIDDVFAALGAFASIIATMGLIGISLHTMRRRTREIAVRKVNGASVRQILWMLLANFSKPIVIANIAAWPLAYVVMRGYLSLFAVRSGPAWIPFLLSLAIALVVGWVAVVAQAARAASASPALVLRRE
jgi:putative ABC transport system permease protein